MALLHQNYKQFYFQKYPYQNSILISFAILFKKKYSMNFFFTKMDK